MGILVAPDELKTQIVATGTPVEGARGTYLFRHGDPVTGVFLIVEGAIRLGLDCNPASFPWRSHASRWKEPPATLRPT